MKDYIVVAAIDRISGDSNWKFALQDYTDINYDPYLASSSVRVTL